MGHEDGTGLGGAEQGAKEFGGAGRGAARQGTANAGGRLAYGEPKPARLGEQLEVAGGMPAWVREEPVGQKQRQRRGGKKQKKVGSGRVATVAERRRIVALRARGLTYQAIANELGLSYATVRQEFG